MSSMKRAERAPRSRARTHFRLPSTSFALPHKIMIAFTSLAAIGLVLGPGAPTTLLQQRLATTTGLMPGAAVASTSPVVMKLNDMNDDVKRQSGDNNLKVAAGGGSMSNIPRGAPFAEFYTSKSIATPTRRRRREPVAPPPKDSPRTPASEMVRLTRLHLAALGCAAAIGAGVSSVAAQPAPQVDVPTIATTKKMAATRAASRTVQVSTPTKAGGGKRSRSRRGEDASDPRSGSGKSVADQADLGNLRVQDVKRPWGADRQFGDRISDSAELITAESRRLRFDGCG